MGSEYHDDSFSGNHNSFVFYNQKSWTGEFALGHDTSYGSAYGVFLFRQYFMEMPDSLYESARIDGCSVFQTFRKIYVPLAKPMFITLGVSFFVTNWNSYLWSTIVAQDETKYTIQIQIATLMGSLRISWNQILAASVIAIVPTVLLFGVLQRYYLEGIKTTGMKE